MANNAANVVNAVNAANVNFSQDSESEAELSMLRTNGTQNGEISSSINQ